MNNYLSEIGSFQAVYPIRSSLFCFSFTGKGVVTKKDINFGDYILHYTGKYSTEDFEGDDSYVFETKYKNVIYYIDATMDDGFAKFFNDCEKNPNMRVKQFIVEEKPVPVFIATRNIFEGSQLEYSYGPGEYEWRGHKTPANHKVIKRAIHTPIQEEIDDSNQKTSCKRKLFSEEEIVLPKKSRRFVNKLTFYIYYLCSRNDRTNFSLFQAFNIRNKKYLMTPSR